MSSMKDEIKDQLSVDLAGLYREEVITDLKAATFKVMIPVKIDGSEDESRERFISAQTSVMSPMGVIPLQAKLEAKNLEEAAAEFPAAIEKAMDRLIEEAKEMQRQEASKIVVPNAPANPGKIQLG